MKTTGPLYALLAVLVALLLAGCQASGSRTGYYSSPLQPGDEVQMLRELTVPAGKARIYLQGGRTTSYGGTNQYEPFCYFLLRDPLPNEQVIKPGTFVVESVWLDQTTVSREFPVRVAGIAMGGFGNRSPVAFQFHIALKSSDQQDTTLVCSGAFDDPISAAPIRMPEVRQALGDYAEVREKPAPPR